jgi:hypothetical protein
LQFSHNAATQARPWKTSAFRFSQFAVKNFVNPFSRPRIYAGDDLLAVDPVVIENDAMRTDAQAMEAFLIIG